MVKRSESRLWKDVLEKEEEEEERKGFHVECKETKARTYDDGERYIILILSVGDPGKERREREKLFLAYGVLLMP